MRTRLGIYACYHEDNSSFCRSAKRECVGGCREVLPLVDVRIENPATSSISVQLDVCRVIKSDDGLERTVCEQGY